MLLTKNKIEVSEFIFWSWYKGCMQSIFKGHERNYHKNSIKATSCLLWLLIYLFSLPRENPSDTILKYRNVEDLVNWNN